MDGITTYDITASLNTEGQPVTSSVVNVTNIDATMAIVGTPGATGPPGPTGATGPTGPAGVGVPTGGTTNQVLTKNSNTNYDDSWQTPATAPVSSVFGRTGAVTAQTADYTATQVGALPSTDDISAIATANPTAASWSNNSKKITSLANGSAASDAAAFGQIPTALPPNGSAGGDLTGTYPNPTVGTNKIDNTKLAQMAANSIKGNNTGSPANAADLTAAQTKTLLAITEADVANLTTDLGLKAPLASPTFTGTVTVPTPVNSTDASTKAYVDATAQGLSVKASVQEATNGALPTNTYLLGVITITATGVLTVDGQTVALNDRVLVKDEVTQANNGIYTCTTAGAIGVQAVLTRASDSNTGAEILGAFCFVEKGTANADSGFVNTNTSTPTLGTTPITYTQFSGAGEITAGNGLSKSGNTLSINTAITLDETSAQTISGKKTFNAGALLDKGEIVYDVMAYGAAGDNSTDDTTSIQNAINAAHTAGGGMVFFPGKTFKITAALTLYAGVNLQGVSPLVSIINQTGTTVDGMTLSNIAENYTHISSLKIEGPSSGSGIGIDLIRTTAGDNQAGVHLQDLIVSGFGSHGVWCTGAIISTMERVTSQSNGGDGFHIEQSGTNAGSTSVTFISCYALSNTGKGYYMGQNGTSSYLSMVSCAADSNAVGYYFTGITNVSLHACGSEGNGISYEVTGSTHISFLSCLSSASTNIDYWITGSSTKIILQNTYASSAGAGHTAGVQVDSGSHALLINHENSSSVIAAGGNIFNGSVVQMDEKMPITPRVVSATTAASPAPNGDTTDLYELTAQAGAASFSDGTGAPLDGQKLMVRIKDNGSSQTLSWSGGFASSGVATLPTSTPLGKTMTLGFMYNSTLAKWVLMALDSVGY